MTKIVDGKVLMLTALRGVVQRLKSLQADVEEIGVAYRQGVIDAPAAVQWLYEIDALDFATHSLLERALTPGERERQRIQYLHEKAVLDFPMHQAKRDAARKPFPGPIPTRKTFAVVK